MTRALLLIVLVLLVMASVAGARVSDLYSSSWDKGVVVVLYGTQYGTAWWINENHLVTAAHVVNYQSHITVTIMHGDYTGKATVIYVDQVHDIAILRADSRPASQYIFKLSTRGPEKGDTIFVIGYPFELYKIVGDLQKMSANPRVTQGVVAWVYPEKYLFEFSAATDSGNSGGPIVDAYGNVIGLVSFAMSGEAATLYYGSSVEAIKQACRSVGVKYYSGLSSGILSTSGSTPVNPALVGAIAGGIAAVLTTVMIIPVIKSRRR